MKRPADTFVLSREFGARLRVIRLRAGLTQLELARAAVERVWSEVQLLMRDANVPRERRPVYRGLVGACCTAALTFEPGSEGEKQQLDEYILEPRWIRLGLYTALAQKLADIMLARFRELAKSPPPDPRPKR